MAATTINYRRLMHRALRNVMVEVLEDVAVEGLPGDHHFFISIDTTHPDFEATDWLKEQHPETMTVVIQNWFEDLAVSSEWFEITLSFSGQPVRLHIPFDAILTFVDPSVEFGLRFDEQSEEADDTVDELVQEIENSPSETKSTGSSDVVSLDSFRK